MGILKKCVFAGLTTPGSHVTIGRIPADMDSTPARDRVRFCNNPACERCDEHLRPGEVLRKAGRELCPACHEELVVQESHPRPPRLRTRGQPRPGRG